jgi:hypothetical protein
MVLTQTPLVLTELLTPVVAAVAAVAATVACQVLAEETVVLEL